MKNQDKWFKKRMEDIPKPIAVGEFEMTDEERKVADETLKQFIEMTTGKKVP